MSDLQTRIEQELARVRQNRETYIKDAERQLAMMDGAIAVLEHLLKQADGGAIEPTPTPTPPPPTPPPPTVE